MFALAIADLASLAATAALAWTVLEERAAGRVPFVSLGGRWFGRGRTTTGTLVVALVAGLLLAVLPLVPSIVAGTTTSQESEPLALAAVTLTLLVKLLFVLFEEIAFRGALLDQLRRRFGAAHAIVASALLFGLAHAARPGDPSHAPVVAVTVLDGLGYAAAAVLTGSLWTSVAWHAAKNVAVWQLTGVSTLQFAPGAFAYGAGSTTNTGDVAVAALVVALAVPLVWLLAAQRPDCARPADL
jgi:membrane protease YdiL (CAAX protease family)